MRFLLSMTLISGFLICLCYQKEPIPLTEVQDKVIINKSGNNIEDRFPSPEGFVRSESHPNTYASYLRNLKLKDYDALVHYYDGTTKANASIYCGVIDMDIDGVDLQQCADAIMRLRAEYLYAQQDYEAIHFNFLSDGKPRYYTEYAQGDFSYPKFRKYLRYVFSYANTASLHDELTPVSDPSSIQIGDVFIQKGRPYGHAVIVLDVIESETSSEKQFILAQSYMPAQETQILLNPSSETLSPWYSTEIEIVETPEWTFQWKDLRRFQIVRP